MKRGKAPPLKEEQEGCIVDRLLGEIRKGFPLRKSSKNTPTSGPKLASPMARLGRLSCEKGGNLKKAKDEMQKRSSAAKLLGETLGSQESRGPSMPNV